VNALALANGMLLTSPRLEVMATAPEVPSSGVYLDLQHVVGARGSRETAYDDFYGGKAAPLPAGVVAADGD
jgi:hypothetical protein